MKRIFGLFLLFLITLGVTSCFRTNGGKTIVYGDFRYKINNETKDVMLIGFSKEGEKKETIVIPSHIEGIKVSSLGYKMDFLLDDSIDGNWTHEFKSVKLKTLYINGSIEYDYDNIFFRNSQNNFPNLVNVYDATEMLFVNYNSTNYWIHDYYIDYYLGKERDYECNPANVVYYLDGKVYFIDDCNNSLTNVIPPEPYKEGYNFVGWYKERDYINKWDFENDIIPAKEYDNDGNYIFKQTSLFGKWEKN